MAEIELKDALNQIASAVKGKLDAYGADMKELRRRELAKSGASMCETCGAPKGSCKCMSKTTLGPKGVVGAEGSVTSGSPMMASEMVKDESNPDAKPGSVLPDDKKSKDVSDKDTGSGGQCKKNVAGLRKAAMAATPKAPGGGSPKVGGLPKAELHENGELPPGLKKATIPSGRDKGFQADKRPVVRASVGKLMDNMLGVAPGAMLKPNTPSVQLAGVGQPMPKPMKGHVQTLVERTASRMKSPPAGVDHLAQLPKQAQAAPPPAPAEAFGNKKAAVAAPSAAPAGKK